jgi:stearoyl-CoA desaturase (delta-9 desaturase)
MPEAKSSLSKFSNIDWVTLIFIAAYHVLLVIALPLYLMDRMPSWSLIGWTMFLIAGSLLSITAGYHRLYAHRTYRARKPVEGLMLYFGTLATQGSVLQWSHDHRLHHKHVDTDLDPYSAPRGFWYSHILWMFEKNEPKNERYLKDLIQNKLLVFQDKYYGWVMAITNILTVLLLGWITGDLVGAFVIGFLLRLFIVHHSTWFINSLCHIWGSQPYSTEHTAVNNFILAILTYGEGYHNYHHTFAGDYRNGVRWYQFDPAKYLIWIMSKLGLAWDLKRTDPLMIKKKLIQADRKLLIDHLDGFRDVDVSAFVERVEHLSEKLSAMIQTAMINLNRYRSLDRKENPGELKEWKMKYREIKKEIERDLKDWQRLVHQILDMQPALA